MKGETGKAESLLRAVTTTFGELEMPQEASLAAMELSVALLELGRAGEAKKYAAFASNRLQHEGTPQEAAFAHQVYRKAIWSEKLTVEWALEITRFLAWVEINPKVKWGAVLAERKELSA